MSDIVPFASAQLPAYLRDRADMAKSLNKDVVTAAQFPTLTIKGKVFTLVRDNERKTLMNPLDAEEVAQSIQLSVLRANTKSRVYYAQSYVEGDSDGARPTCYSHDGVAPAPNAMSAQAKKCAICPHAVWGSKLRDDGTAGEGTECAVNTRLAVAPPDDLEHPYLLRVPAGSRKNYADAVKAADARGIPYTAVVMKVRFDPAAPAPKLIFQPVGLLPDAAFAQATAMYEHEVVRAIVGVDEPARTDAPADDGGVDTSELDAALAAKQATDKAAATARPAAKPPAPAAPPAQAPAPAPAAARVAPKAKPPAPAPAPAPASFPGAVSLEELDQVGAATPAPAPAPAPKAPPPVVRPTAAPKVDASNIVAALDDLLNSPDD